ncbi:hypothetical protein NL529_30465, partial [Klebsiella pneumoniae]|nr:hypothetical protein [Klebsiella pneumoniae]
PSDLQVDSVNVPPNGKSGDLVTLKWTVSNHGTNDASGSWSDRVYLSADSLWDVNDISLGRFDHSGALAPNASYEGSIVDAKLPPVKP